jgi:aspartate/methionine/tyrosine aminotransferase
MTGSPLTNFEEAIVASGDVLDFAVGYPRLAPTGKQWDSYKSLVATIESSASHHSRLEALRKTICSLLNEEMPEFLITYSGSIALERTISALIPNNRSTLLIEPGFDIINSFVCRATSLPPTYLHLDPFMPREESVKALIRRIDKTIGAVVLVSPNNPSGLTLSEAELDEVAEACAMVDAIIIVDHCFMLIDPNDCHPGVAFRLGSKCRWAALWDSSKTIELLGERFAIISGSRNEFSAVENLLDEIQLEWPMGSLVVLSKVLDDLRSNSYLAELHKIVRSNYAQLEKACSSVGVGVNHPDAGSFALVRLDKQRFGVADAAARWLLDTRAVGVLPASLFYMSQSPAASNFIRISLARSPEVFSTMCDAIVALANKL